MRGEKRPARVHGSDSKDDIIGEAIKKLAIDGEQMASVMQQMQDSQAQQIQVMSQLVGCCLNNELNNELLFYYCLMRFTALISCHYTLICSMIMIILNYSEFYSNDSN